MIKNNKRKSNFVIFTVISLASISLATIGFSSWIIKETKDATTDNIKIEVGKVVDDTLSATIEEGADLSVRFDNIKDGAIATSDTVYEDLNFSFTVDVLGTGTKKGLKFEFSENATLTTLATNNYIDMPYSSATFTVSETGASDSLKNGSKVTVATSTTDSTKMIFTCSFKFAWGSVFSNMNPTKLYEKYKNEGTANDINTLLQNLKAFGKASESLVSSGAILTCTVTPVIG